LEQSNPTRLSSWNTGSQSVGSTERRAPCCLLAWGWHLLRDSSILVPFLCPYKAMGSIYVKNKGNGSIFFSQDKLKGYRKQTTPQGKIRFPGKCNWSLLVVMPFDHQIKCKASQKKKNRQGINKAASNQVAPPDVARQGNVKGHSSREAKARAGTRRGWKNSVPNPCRYLEYIFASVYVILGILHPTIRELEDWGGDKLLGDRNGHDHPSRTVIEDMIP
jgi:hypothetical protein